VSVPIDERTAWTLVRKVTPGLTEKGLARVHHDPRPEVWLQVQASGQWQASASMSPDARDLFELYLPLQLRADLVIGQLGQSLDGRIATAAGQSHYITGPADITRLHRLRALVDAVIVGAGTVAADNPRLTVRQVEGGNPVRVVLDPEGRLGPDRHVFSDGASRTLVVRRAGSDAAPPGPGGEILTMPASGDGGFDPRALLAALRDRGCRRVLVEGGGITVSRFLAAGVVDRLHVTVAPLILGSGRPALTLPPIDSLDQALRPRCRYVQLGADMLFDLDLRPTRQPHSWPTPHATPAG
jgi:diaminohydroxyphosphoribosylaminopyrimidine deaminase / 5-amino-6-(5-phosphoribosylamino)uracil reductase